MRGSSWREFEAASPEMAQAGRRLLYRGSETASAFLATAAPDGGPRLHPIYPVIADGELWMFIVDMSPKYRDLCRNGHFALHALPPPGGGEEFHVRGHSEQVSDAAAKERIAAATEGRQGAHDFEALFRCMLRSVLHTQWADWGSPSAWPSYAKWHG